MSESPARIRVGRYESELWPEFGVLFSLAFAGTELAGPERRAAHVRPPSRMEDWGNSVEKFFAQTFIHTIVSDAEILRS